MMSSTSFSPPWKFPKRIPPLAIQCVLTAGLFGYAAFVFAHSGGITDTTRKNSSDLCC